MEEKLELLNSGELGLTDGEIMDTIIQSHFSLNQRVLSLVSEMVEHGNGPHKSLIDLLSLSASEVRQYIRQKGDLRAEGKLSQAITRRNKLSPGGRLTEGIIMDIANLVRAGNYLDTSALACGVDKDILVGWLEQGEKDKESKRKTIYTKLVEALTLATAESEITDLELVTHHSLRSWQAAAWRMERRFNDKWGRKDKISSEITGRDGGPIELSDDREQLISRLFPTPSQGDSSEEDWGYEKKGNSGTEV